MLSQPFQLFAIPGEQRPGFLVKAMLLFPDTYDILYSGLLRLLRQRSGQGQKSVLQFDAGAVGIFRENMQGSLVPLAFHMAQGKSAQSFHREAAVPFGEKQRSARPSLLPLTHAFLA